MLQLNQLQHWLYRSPATVAPFPKVSTRRRWKLCYNYVRHQKKIVSTIITNPRGDQYIQVRIRSADDLYYSRAYPAIRPSIHPVKALMEEVSK